MAKVHELFKKFLNGVFDLKTLLISAMLLTTLVILKSEILLISQCLDMRFWLGSKLFARTEFFISVVIAFGLFFWVLILLSMCYTFRIEPSDSANYYLRFPKLKGEIICLLVFANIAFIPVACGNLRTLDSVFVICSHVCDSVGLCELAERLNSFDIRKGSFYVEKWCFSSRETGKTDPDPKFDQIIKTVYGPQSADMAFRYLQLSKFYRCKSEFSKAIEEAYKALSVCEKPYFTTNKNYFGLIKTDALLEIALNYVLIGESEKAKTVLKRTMKTLSISPEYLDISIEKLAKSVNDQDTLKKLDELRRDAKIIEHTQFIHPNASFHSFKVHTTPFLSLLAALAIFAVSTSLSFSRYSIHAVPGIERELKSASFEESLELLQDLIAIELFYKNHEAVDRHSRRFLELCREAA
ncbi:MAG: hypothetical protein KIT34_05030 [Cyanobacteria bacterium TGS_CYA1]|nr:hypothetical protein [Cyanobacteria bacterium TGS_CYA1]